MGSIALQFIFDFSKSFLIHITYIQVAAVIAEAFLLLQVLLAALLRAQVAAVRYFLLLRLLSTLIHRFLPLLALVERLLALEGAVLFTITVSHVLPF
jgi:hypothetical protein